MDRAVLEFDFARADEHVVQGMQHIARQHAIIKKLERRGHDVSAAMNFLDLLQQTQALHMLHRDRLACALEEMRGN